MSLLNNTCFDIMEMIGTQVERIRQDKIYADNHRNFTNNLRLILLGYEPIYEYLDGCGNMCPQYIFEDFDLSSYDDENISYFRNENSNTLYANPSTYPEYARENGCIPDGDGGWEGEGIVQTGYN
jgi:hypothetical protein|tara:strand:+ start:99 stop:473 length:375 start_codon:yes stop_codon:yes gene_type:complete